ncbi:MAG: type sorting protein, partial [Bacteroidota bacterium]|nr:type sorting protein [Bacteroidota bacterium]
VTFPTSVSSLAYLDISPTSTRTVNLSSDLSLAMGAAIASSGIKIGSNGILNTNTKNLYFSSATGSAGADLSNSGRFNADGSTITFDNDSWLNSAFTGVFNTTGASFIFNSSVGAVTLPSTLTEVHNLTLETGNTFPLTVGADFTVNGGLTINTLQTFTSSNNSLTVKGPFNNNVAFPGTINISQLSTKTTTLSGEIYKWGTVNTNNQTILVLDGTGSISDEFPASAPRNFLDLTLSKEAAELTFPDIGATIAIAGDLSIIRGNLNIGDNDMTVAGDAFINGALYLNGLNANRGATFTGSLSGAGYINGSGDEDFAFIRTVTANGDYQFTGNLITNTATDLTFGVSTGSIQLQSSVMNLRNLTFNSARSLSLSSNLDLASSLVFNSLAKITIGSGRTLTVGAAFSFASNGTIDATGSTLIFESSANFNNGLLTAGSNTKLTFMNTVTAFPININQLYDLNLLNGGTLTLTGNMEIGNDLYVSAAGSILTAGGYNLSITRLFSVGGTFDATSMTSNNKLSLSGVWIADNASSIIKPENINLYVSENPNTQLSLPAAVNKLYALTLQRSAGIKIGIDMTIGNAGSGFVINLISGKTDLNGYNVTLAGTNNKIKESAGNTIINTGTASAYITTQPNLTRTQAINSGLGIASFGSSTPTNITVKRYPVLVPVLGIGNSISRNYRITFTGGTLTDISLKYDDSELNGIGAAGLKIYRSDASDFISGTYRDSSRANSADPNNKTIAGTGGFAAGASYHAVTNDYFTLAGLSGLPGTIKIFNNSAGNGLWSTASNWTPSGVPGLYDDVYIGPYTVYANGDGQVYTAKSITLTKSGGVLTPSVSTSGDNVKISLFGNLTLREAGSSVVSVNGRSRLNFEIGDGTTANISCEISTPTDYSQGNGIWFHDLTINKAEIKLMNDKQYRISGNLSLIGNSSISPNTAGESEIVLFGGYSSLQTIFVTKNIAFADLNKLTLSGSAYVTSASDITVRRALTISTAQDKFLQTENTLTFQSNMTDIDQLGWNNPGSGQLELYNVSISNNSGDYDYTPSGNVSIAGNFIKNGTGSMIHNTNGIVTFKNTSQKVITHGGTSADLLKFYNLLISTGSNIKTSSSFYINGGSIEQQGTGKFLADLGTIYFEGTSPQIISNQSGRADSKNSDKAMSDLYSVKFFDLTVNSGCNLTSSTDWSISGNLRINAGGSLKSANGSVAFDNLNEKVIDNAGGAPENLTFYKLVVTSGSKVTTESNHDFYISNNSSNYQGSGVDIQGAGSLIIGGNGITYFHSDIGTPEGNPKIISKSAAGILKFVNLSITNSAGNEVKATGDFELTGTGSLVFHNQNGGIGGKFYANAGTVSFTGSNPGITSKIRSAVKFFNLKAENCPLNLPAGNTTDITANLTINGSNGLFTGSAGSEVQFNGSDTQYINGTSVNTSPANFSILRINKTGTNESIKELVLEANITITDASTSSLDMVSGFLNLGSKTMRIGGGNHYYMPGKSAINGGTGTLYVTAPPDYWNLRDLMFSPDGVTPTLYNLTISLNPASGEIEISKNGNERDLTVNGNLFLDAGKLKLGNGANAERKLAVYGNVSRSNGLFSHNASPNIGTLVLTGSGSVSSMNNSYWSSGKSPNIEFGRTETLSGDLITDTDSEILINTGVGLFNLGANTLDAASNPGKIRILSGSISAGTASTVKLDYSTMTSIPANMFLNNKCGNLVYNNAAAGSFVRLDGNLEIDGMFTQTGAAAPFSIFTGNNTLTFGKDAILALPFNSSGHIIGSLRRAVGTSQVKFDVGDGSNSSYRPLTLQYESSINDNFITVSSKAVDPTGELGGNPSNAVDIYWSILPDEIIKNNKLKIGFQWSQASENNGTAAKNGSSFPAHFQNSNWRDFRTAAANFTVSDPRILQMSSFAVSSDSIEGIWAIFNSVTNTDKSKDSAISKAYNKLAFIDVAAISPAIIPTNQYPFKAFVQLQDRYGQPITAETNISISITKVSGSGTPLEISPVTGVIAKGSNSCEINGIYTTAATSGEDNFQLSASTTVQGWQPGLSKPFKLLGNKPVSQATQITFGSVTANSLSIGWTQNTANNNVLLIGAAEDLLNEYPKDGEIYSANTIFGAGSVIGNGAVLYKGDGTTRTAAAANSVKVTGLSPNTKYYFYLFAYSGGDGTVPPTPVSYINTPGAQNPNSISTSGSSY